ncbi:hypothetical protein 16Q_135 [Pseudomonas phage 16Q]|nr:hypothetical protein 16Q_135 [Pseudomonas phage 16Q]
MSKEFKLVPVLPTEEMLEAGNLAASKGGCDLYGLKRELLNGYAAMLASAPQPPALGMEPEVVGYGFRNTMVGRRPVMMELRPDIPANDQYGGQLWYPLITQDDHHARLAQLQAEIERLTALCIQKDERMAAMNESWAGCITQRDQLKERCNEFEESLEQIATWPDGGNTYGQDKIKGFANRILYGSEHI